MKQTSGFLLVAIFLVAAWTDVLRSDETPVKRKATEGPLFAYQKDGLWGFIDKTGDVIFEPQFSTDYAEPRFSSGYAIVKYKGRPMYLSQRGDVVVPPKEVSVLSGYSGGLFKVNIGQKIKMGDILASAGRWGFMDAEGEMKIQATFANVGTFSDGLASAAQVVAGQRRAKWGYIDMRGEWIVPPKFQQAQTFFEGLAFVGVVVPGERFVKQACIDTMGKVVIRPQFDQARSFSCESAAVMKDGKWAYIDKMGAAICNFEFQAAEPMKDNVGLVWKWEKNAKGQLINSRCGFLNRDGTPLTGLDFDSGYSFSDGMAAVQRNGKFGFVDTTGKLVVPMDYMSVGAFREGLCAVQIEGKYGYINKKGKVVIAATYDFGQPFHEGVAKVFLNRANREYGYINRDGKLLIRFRVQPPRVRF